VVGTHDPDGNIGRLGTVVNGVFGSSSTGDGVYGETSNVQASGIHGEAASSGATGVRGQNSAPGGTGVLGTVDAASGLGTGVIGEVGSPDGVGVFGSNTHYGTMGFVGAQSGVVGLNNSNQGVAVFGQCATVTAVYGETSGPPLQAAGVFGKNLQSGSFGALGVDVGAFGISQSNIGVLAQSSSGQPALEADNYGGGEAGSFLGDVSVQGNLDIVSGDAVINGNLNVSGSKNFRIDHPLDPANKYLVHSCIESPEMMNVYNGNVVTDASGDATVTLPDYFESLNRDFRYQLTVIGQFATAIVARKVNDNRFTVRTDYPHVEVSWQVTGIRQDAFARAHPVQVEQDKPMIERGRYLAPVEHGQPKSLGIGYDKQGERHPRCKLPVTVESVPCDRAKRLR
jgi:hypothetical protein